jgi:hypothetical protein
MLVPVKTRGWFKKLVPHGDFIQKHPANYESGQPTKFVMATNKAILFDFG